MRQFPLRMVSSDWVVKALLPSVPLVSAPGRCLPVPVSIRKEHCHGRLGSLIFILSYLKTRDPERILPYAEESHIHILIG